MGSRFGKRLTRLGIKVAPHPLTINSNRLGGFAQCGVWITMQSRPLGLSLLGVYAYVAQCSLPAGFIELTYLRVSQINNCAYCLDMHTRALIEKGDKPERLALLQAWPEAGSLFNERERAALAWAEFVTRVEQTNVPDAAYEAACSVFDEKELVDLTIAISLMNAYNRMAISFRNPPQASAPDKS